MSEVTSHATMRDYCRRAVWAQNASNLSGVVHSMSQAMTFLWEEARALNKGTEWVNHHPLSVLYATQVAALTNVAPIASDACNYTRAYNYCADVAEGKAA